MRYVKTGHQCLIYKGGVEEALRVVTPWLRAGLREGMRAMYVADPSTLRAVEEALERDGVCVEDERRRGALILSADRPQLQGGAFVPRRMLELVSGAIDDALAAGFKGLYATGDMTWEFGHIDNYKVLLEYEALLDRANRGRPLSAICQYPLDAIPKAAVREAVLCHRTIHVGRFMCVENQSYVKPAVLLSEPELVSHRREAEWMWRQLRRAAAAQRRLNSLASRTRRITEHFECLAESADDAFWLLDESMRTVAFVSKGYERLWERPGTELQSTPLAWLESVHVDDRARVSRAFHSAIDGARWDESYRIVGRNGKVRWIRDRAIRPRPACGSYVVRISEDATELKQAESRSLHFQRMDAFGKLAAGIAHDFNNVLTAIMGFSGLLLATMSGKDPHRDDISAIEASARTAAALTKQLLIFGRKQILMPVVFDVNAAVEETRRMLERVLGEDIQLEVSMCPTPPRVRADPGHFQQVLLNLAVNARDAMPRGGKLRIQTDLRPGRRIRILISDTGSGMTPEVQKRLFDPFFTTKEPGKGVGLGLTIVREFMDQHGGTIEVQSSIGTGSSFTLLLPSTDEAPTDAETSPSSLLRGTGRVLIVEDDAPVRSAVSQALKACGYAVSAVRTVDDAIQVLEAEEFDLLVTDVVLPGANIPDLLARTQKLHPRIKVLYISGYTEDVITRYGIEHGDVHLLQKPFSPTQLALRVRQLIGVT